MSDTVYLDRLSTVLDGAFSLRRSVPLNDKHHVCDVGTGDRCGQRGNDGIIGNADGVTGSVANTGHIAADASDAASQTLIAAPVTGCYMTGVGNSSGNTVSVAYDAIVTPLSAPVTGANIANVVFVIEWDTAE